MLLLNRYRVHHNKLSGIKTLQKFIIVFVAVVVGLLPSFLSAEEVVTLKEIKFGALPGNRFEIRMEFDGQPPTPKEYTIEKPARIVLDLPQTKSALTRKKHALSFGNAKSVIVMEGSGRTRIIVNLIELEPHASTIENNTIVVNVGTDEVKDFMKSAEGNVIEAALVKNDLVDITNIDFRRGDKGEGKVIIALGNPDIEADVSFESGKIKIEFMGTILPDRLRRRLDVRDFATPVEKIEATYASGVTKIEVTPVGDYDYLAYQADNQYVISVKPLTKQEILEKSQKFAFVGDKLSLNFQDIEVRSVLQLIADFTDLNLVASDTVRGKITLRLLNVPWDQALDLILKTKGLDKRQIGNVLLIAPAAEIAARERQEIQTNKQILELAPLRMEYIRILYADAKEVFDAFKGTTGDNSNQDNTSDGLMSARGTVILDERTNSLLITETEVKLAEIRKIISLIDIPIRQVMIEARIVVAKSDTARELGFKWLAAEGDSGPRSTNGGVFLGNSVLNGGTAIGALTDVSPAGANNVLSLGFREGDYLLDLELSALESSGHGEIVSQPKVITGDKQTASIKSGTEIPYREASSSGAASVSFKDAVLQLEVTPHITPDDRIIMDLKINQDEVGEIELASGIPTIDTTELSTQVLVNNGETIVLGGIFKVNTVIARRKVPFLGDIPWIGALFRQETRNDEKIETLIFITPRILADRIID